MAINVLINSEKRVLNFYGTDIQLKTVDQLPEQPQAKVGINHVAYYNEQTNKVEYREEARELTLEERLINAEKKADASMEAIAELYETGN